MYMIDANIFMNAVLGIILGLTVVLLCVTLFAAGVLGKRRGRLMSYLYMFTALFSVFSAVVLVLGFRGQKSSARPWHFFLDMKYQAKYTTQGQSKYFADGRSNRLPPENAIPFDGTDYFADAGHHTTPNPDFLKADKRYYFGIANPDAKGADGVPAKPKWEGNKLAGEGYWVNHIPPLAVEKAGGWEAMFKRGQTQFNRHCAVCHGASGRGGGGELAYGIVGAYGLSVAPANLTDAGNAPHAPSLPDGHIFNTLTNGKGSMPGYGHQIKDPLDRWSIVAYLRVLQYATNGPVVEKK